MQRRDREEAAPRARPAGRPKASRPSRYTRYTEAVPMATESRRPEQEVRPRVDDERRLRQEVRRCRAAHSTGAASRYSARRPGRRRTTGSRRTAGSGGRGRRAKALGTTMLSSALTKLYGRPQATPLRRSARARTRTATSRAPATPRRRRRPAEPRAHPPGGGLRGRAAAGLVAEAAHGAGVAGRAGRLDGEQHRVVVAVQPRRHARAARCRWCRPCARARGGCGSRSAPRRWPAWRAGPPRWRRRP